MNYSNSSVKGTLDDVCFFFFSQSLGGHKLVTASHYSFHSHPKVMLGRGWRTEDCEISLFYGALPSKRPVGQTE